MYGFAFFSDPVVLGLCLTVSIKIGNMTPLILQSSTEVSKGVVAADVLHDFCEEISELDTTYDSPVPPALWPHSGELKINNLYMTYSDSNRFVLENVSLDVKPGEKLAIFGRTGSGKSSLLKAILKMYPLDYSVNPGQSITINGRNIQAVGSLILRQRIGVIGQEAVLLNGSLRFNVDPLQVHTDPEVLQVLEIVGLFDPARHDPQAFLAQKLGAGLELSLGQRQLLGLARVLAQRPALLLLDEAAASVDAKTERLVSHAVTAWLPNTAVLAVAHRREAVAGFDTEVLMADGKILHVGPML